MANKLTAFLNAKFESVNNWANNQSQNPLKPPRQISLNRAGILVVLAGAGGFVFGNINNSSHNPQIGLRFSDFDEARELRYIQKLPRSSLDQACTAAVDNFMNFGISRPETVALPSRPEGLKRIGPWRLPALFGYRWEPAD